MLQTSLPTVRSELGPTTTLPALFEWRFSPSTHLSASRHPASIYLSPGHGPSRLLSQHIKNGSQRFNHTIVAVGGSDRRLSQAAHFGLHVDVLLRTFRIVYWETIDHVVPGLRPLPTLFTDRYLRDAGPSVAEAMRGASLDDTSKPLWLFASWGRYQPQLDRSPNCRDRQAAVRWLQGMANASWISKGKRSPKEYWPILARHRFALSPSGLGIQSPKTYEALAVLTIPICHRTNLAYAQLAAEGWPIVLVDSWEHVTIANMRRWWAFLAHKLRGARSCFADKGRMYRMLVSGETMGSCIQTAEHLHLRPSHDTREGARLAASPGRRRR